jgi:D-alanine transaminase
MPELASVNGRMLPIAEACIPIDDRGFLLGDGVYEVIVVRGGKLLLFDEHLARLRRSLDGVRMNYVELPPIVAQVRALCAAAGLPEAKLYLQVTRGVAPRNHAFPQPAPAPNVVMTVRELHPLAAESFADGVACLTRPDIRWGRVDIKTINLLPNCLAKQDAAEAGCFEAIFIGPDGAAREATAANLFVVRGGVALTHPENERILSGVTRNLLLRLMRENGMPVREVAATREEMMTADEVFLTGTTTEVMPVVRIDGRPIGGGKPGPFARRLLAIFRDWLAKAIV